MTRTLLNKLSFIILIAAVFAMPLSFAAPAFAATPGFSHAPAVNSETGTGASLNWSGYEATGGTYTAVGGTWTIPSVAATSSLSADATWVGIGGVTSHDLIQIGTQEVTGNGADQVQYEAWIETLPQATQEIPVTLHAGDSVTASVTQVSSGEWQFSFHDNTTGAGYSTQVAYQSSLASAEWIEEAPTDQDGIMPLDQFGTISFTDAYVTENGTELTPSAADAAPLAMMNAEEQAIAMPSALGSDGASFAISRTSAPASLGGASSGSFGFTRGRGHRIGVGIQGFSPRPVSGGATSSSLGASGTSYTYSGGGASGLGMNHFRIRFSFIGFPQQEEQQLLQMIQQGFNRGM